jgi:hypothetical protein
LQVFNAHQKCAREKQERIEQRQIGGISELWELRKVGPQFPARNPAITCQAARFHCQRIKPPRKAFYTLKQAIPAQEWRRNLFLPERFFNQSEDSKCNSLVWLRIKIPLNWL